MSKLRWFTLVNIAVLLSLLLAACAAPAATPVPQTPEVIIKEVTKIVAGTPVTEKVEVVVTATPEPTVSPYDDNAKIVLWLDGDRQPAFDLWKQTFPEKAKLVETTLANRGQFPAKVLLFNNTGSGWPDVVFAEPNLIAQVADAAHDFPLDLTEWVSPEIIQGYPEAALAPCYSDGKLVCLRNDVAQYVLYYNKPLMDQFGYEVPTTWEEYQALSDQVAAEHPGYIMGAFGDAYSAWANFFWASGCPVNEVLSVSKVRIAAEDPKCVRAAELADHMLANGTLARTDPFDPTFVQTVKDGKLLMLQGPSWMAQYIFGGKPDSMYYQTSEQQLGVAAPLKWQDQAQPIAGSMGGGAYAVSRHTKNPKLATELATWLATATEYHGTGPTFPAYGPASDAWAQTVAGSDLYANDPFPVFKEAANYTSPLDNQPRYDWYTPITEIVKTTNANKTSVVDMLKSVQEKLVPLAEAQGYEVVTE